MKLGDGYPVPIRFWRWMAALIGLPCAISAAKPRRNEIEKSGKVSRFNSDRPRQ